MSKKNSKKILHLVGGMNIGGTETMLMNLYREVYKDIQFDFISYYDGEGYYDKEIRKLDGKIIRLTPPNKIGFIKAVNELVYVIKSGGYDAVHTHTLFNCGIGVFAAWRAGVKVRISHAHTTADKSDSFVKKIYITLMRGIIKIFSTNYLACSDNAGKYLFGENIISNKKYKKLPNYINYEKIVGCNDKTSIRNELGLNKNDILVGHVGRFMEAKNHMFLIDILKQAMDNDERIKVVLVGDGELRSNIEEKVKSLGLEEKIFFLGLREDIDVIFNNLDLFILPSTYEGLGLVLLEAQAAGVPCLVSEAIQPEADLELGLLKKLSLRDSKKEWQNNIFRLLKANKVNKEKILNGFEKKGYKIESLVKELSNIYGI